MKTETARRQTWSKKLDWFFIGYSDTDREKLWYLLKRLFWLGLWVSAVGYAVAMIVSLCTGKGVASLALLIPIGISVFISLFFRFD